MALSVRPVGPEPSATYWARRAGLAASLLLVLLVVGLLISSTGPDTVATGSPTPRPTPEASADPSASPAASLGPCQDTALDVEVRTEQDSYAVGGRPLLMLSVTNTGTVQCSRDLGQAAIELLVVSGSDRIWSSDDCAPGGPGKIVTLEPGEPSRAQVTWPGQRSLPGCQGPKADAQAGTYRVSARIGALRVEGRPFQLTG